MEAGFENLSRRPDFATNATELQVAATEFEANAIEFKANPIAFGKEKGGQFRILPPMLTQPLEAGAPAAGERRQAHVLRL